MALSNLFGWTNKANEAAASACGTACGGADKATACGTACGGADKATACGTACGASDK